MLLKGIGTSRKVPMNPREPLPFGHALRNPKRLESALHSCCLGVYFASEIFSFIFSGRTYFDDCIVIHFMVSSKAEKMLKRDPKRELKGTLLKALFDRPLKKALNTR